MSQQHDDAALQYDDPEPADSEPEQSTQTESTADRLLLEDEDLLVETRPTWWNWTPHAIGAGLLALVGLVLGTEGAILGLVAGFAIAGYIWYRRSRVRYLVTDRRIIVSTGFSAKTTTETWMEDIRGLQMKTTAFGRQQGYGSITVSHGVIPQGFSRTTGIKLSGVPNHDDVATTIRQRQSSRKRGDR